MAGGSSSCESPRTHTTETPWRCARPVRAPRSRTYSADERLQWPAGWTPAKALPLCQCGVLARAATMTRRSFSSAVAPPSRRCSTPNGPVEVTPGMGRPLGVDSGPPKGHWPAGFLVSREQALASPSAREGRCRWSGQTTIWRPSRDAQMQDGRHWGTRSGCRLCGNGSSRATCGPVPGPAA
jgi:hypothetical protein